MGTFKICRTINIAQPMERGEALTVTDFEAVCHRSIPKGGWWAQADFAEEAEYPPRL